MLHQVILISIYYIFPLAVGNQGRSAPITQRRGRRSLPAPRLLGEGRASRGGHARVEGPVLSCGEAPRSPASYLHGMDCTTSSYI